MGGRFGATHIQRERDTHQHTTIHPEIERILIYYTFITARISMANELWKTRCDTDTHTRKRQLLRCRIRTRLKLILIVFKLKKHSEIKPAKKDHIESTFERIMHDKRFVQTTRHAEANKLFCFKNIMYSTAVLAATHNTLFFYFVVVIAFVVIAIALSRSISFG